MKKAVTIVSLLMIASACSSITGIVERDYVEVDDDSFKPHIEYSGIAKLETGGGTLSGYSVNWYLRSFVQRDSGEVTHQVYTMVNYIGSWHNYRIATIEGGDELEMKVLDREVRACTATCALRETIAVTVPAEMLAGAGDGLQFKLYAHSGHSVLVEVTHRQIEAQLAAVNVNQ